MLVISFFDFAFNFQPFGSCNLDSFLSELCRVVSGPILLCVPNQDGLGFKGQLKGYNRSRYPFCSHHLSIIALSFL